MGRPAFGRPPFSPLLSCSIPTHDEIENNCFSKQPATVRLPIQKLQKPSRQAAMKRRFDREKISIVVLGFTFRFDFVSCKSKNRQITNRGTVMNKMIRNSCLLLLMVTIWLQAGQKNRWTIPFMTGGKASRRKSFP
jgi:hypothetical protein